MTRSKRIFKKRVGNGGRKKKEATDVRLQRESDATRLDNSVASTCSNVSSTPTASHRKLTGSHEFYNKFEEVNVNSCEGNIIVNIEILSQLISGIARCKFCESDNSLSFFEDPSKRLGLVSKLFIKCKVCSSEDSVRTSTKCDIGYENNIRFIYGMRAIGKGQASASNFCAIMNLPKPPSRFQNLTKTLGQVLMDVAIDSMKLAVAEVVDGNGGCKNVTVALDGTWQKRGHKSFNGVVSATSIESGKVIDVEVLSKYCQGCKYVKDNVTKELHIKSNKCSANYQGVSGGMEAAGAVAIFQRSEQLHGVKYTKYLGDGDSKGFKKVVEAAPYGVVEVEKLECIGHVQKRMGGRLRKLRTDLKFSLLSDGKEISGKGRLTDEGINKLQSYYGNAIRKNVNNVDEMRRAVWAIYFHSTSADPKPMHNLCPSGTDSWCMYNKAKSTGGQYSHKHAIPSAIAEVIKPVFKNLADPELLRKCIHGLTQNPNESFNDVIWTRVPKTVFVGLKTLKLGVYDAVISFNDGCKGRIEVLQKLGVKPGINMIAAYKDLDIRRLREADKEAKRIYKSKRNHNKVSDEEGDPDDPMYGAGMH